MPRLNVEARVMDALRTALDGVEVRFTVPSKRPARLVTVRREGGRKLDSLRDQPGIGVFIWAETEAEAASLAEKVGDAILSLRFQDGFAKVDEEAMYSTPDPDSGSPRWYASYTLVTYKY